MAMYGSLARPPGGPPSDCLNDGTDDYSETFPPGKATIGQFSDKEWTPEGA